MIVAVNFYYWYAAVWSAAILLYGLEWSRLNAPLEPGLRTFLIATIVTSLILGALHQRRALRPLSASRSRVLLGFGGSGGSTVRRSWLVAITLASGFLADFAYRGEIPVVAGGYEGYDPTLPIQKTVGIPILHVLLIAYSIFFGLLLADRYIRSRDRKYLYQFVLILIVLLLNNSRGYALICILGAMLILFANRRRTNGAWGLRRILLAGFMGYVLLVAFGIFGNVRSGQSWSDSSYIARIGLYQEDYPDFLSGELMWAYTYLTSPLANLNYNVQHGTTDGSLLQSLLAFVPDSLSKYATAEAGVGVGYQVAHLNASTGYADAYVLGGSLGALYLNYGLQVLIFQAGAAVVARLGGAGDVLYAASASIMVVVFIFFNTFSNSATCYLLLLVIATAILRRRNGGRALRGGGAGPKRPRKATLSRPVASARAPQSIQEV